MYKKLLLFVGLAVGVTFASSLLQSSPALAAGENYIWTSATTVEASGGKYKGKTTFTVTNDHKFSGSVTELTAPNINVDVIYGACNGTVGRIVISDNGRAKGSFWIGDLAAGSQTGCGSHPVSDIDMDASVNIKPQAAPPAGGNDAEWKAKNCTTITDAHEKTRCTAIKACVVDKAKAAADCEAAWTSCMAPDQSEGAYTACATQIAAGNVKDAKYTPPKAEEENKTSCRIEAIGWIICPVMRFMAQVTDQAYGIVSGMLKSPPLSTDTGSPTYKAWSVMRNFANVAFVIAFLVVTYAQITGVGLSNYGIKKMLPRIIIAAVLVNVSYWVCAIAVDVTNIAGGSLKGLLEGAGNQLFVDNKGFTGGAGGNWDKVTVGLVGVAGAAAILYAGLSVLLPMLLAALATIVTLVIVLTIRQALIIILIVVSPLAFVAYLLPNTESWFKKWRSTFQVLLVMYPVIAVMFGGCALASTIIVSSAGSNFFLQVMGSGVTIVPLFLAPFIIKSINGGLNRVGLNVNDPTKGPIDRMKKGAEGYRQNRQQLRDSRAMNGKLNFGGRGTMVRRKARRQAVLGQRERNYNNAKTGYISDTALSDDVSAGQKLLSKATGGKFGGNTQGNQLLDQMAKGGGDGAKNAALAQAVSVQAKIEAEEVTAASAVIKHMNLDRDQQAMRDLSQGKDSNGLSGANEAIRAAAMKNVVDSHDVGGVNKLLDTVGSMSEKSREAFADSLASSSQKPEYVGQSAITAIRQHGKTDASGAPIIAKNSTELTAEAINNNTYSVEKLATGDKDELAHVAKIARDTSVATNNANLKANAIVAKTDPRYSGRVGKNAAVVDDISTLP